MSAVDELHVGVGEGELSSKDILRPQAIGKLAARLQSPPGVGELLRQYRGWLCGAV
jgi:hypothetical protein